MSFEDVASLGIPLERWTEEKREKLSSCYAFYSKDKVEHSFQELVQLRSDCEAGEWGEVVDHNQWLISVERDWKEVQDLLDVLGCDEGWTEVRFSPPPSSPSSSRTSANDLRLAYPPVD